MLLPDPIHSLLHPMNGLLTSSYLPMRFARNDIQEEDVLFVTEFLNRLATKGTSWIQSQTFGVAEVLRQSLCQVL